MNLERVEKLLEDIREALNNPTLTDQEKLQLILDIVDIFRTPATDLAARAFDADMLMSYLVALELEATRHSKVRH